MNISQSPLTITYRSLITFLCSTLLFGCAALQQSEDSSPQLINFLIQTENPSPFTYGESPDNWQITSNLVERREKPKTYLYDFTISSFKHKFSISSLKYKYGEHGKWRPLDVKTFKAPSTQTLANHQILQKIPITIKKIGTAHKQIFHLTLTTEEMEKVSLALVFGVNKCIAKKHHEALCF